MTGMIKGKSHKGIGDLSFLNKLKKLSFQSLVTGDSGRQDGVKEPPEH